VTRRYELTDLQWYLMADLFPKQIAGRPCRSDRQILDGIFWRLCSGLVGRAIVKKDCFTK
jgi:transposase